MPWVDLNEALASRPPQRRSGGGTEEEQLIAAHNSRRQASALALWWANQTQDQIEIGDPVWVQVAVPTLLIGAPDVPGAGISWTSTEATKDSHGLSVTVLGAGLGRDATDGITQSITRTAGTGQYTQVVVHLPVRVSEWGFTFHGTHHVQTVRAQVQKEGAPVHMEVRWESIGGPVEAAREFVERPGDVADLLHGPSEQREDSALAALSATVGLDLTPRLNGIAAGIKLTANVSRLLSTQVKSTLPTGGPTVRGTPHKGWASSGSSTNSDAPLTAATRSWVGQKVWNTRVRHREIVDTF
ncbi:hypothetical protein [Cellulomonas dongxiuzhuiae]|uniref:Uncharacterized protein n=1 Tax=Cellulomonas dongxiuzhuiae TaxID=2819979 RepID=A0ABX8GFT2_9CELL|nr:hypothetical protein [Cellulomonas dongxiuzhuiae]MBO3093573.1 hypothetical protein [Cellulomonas dongxiuzhuiae]QWC14698.1 hypothetical protein KKR89_09935 [Cellulomonas dongxiuzhuiae]